MPELIGAVATSDARPTWCYSCHTSEGWEADVIALLLSGLQHIGRLSGCDRCAPDTAVIRCHFCGAVADCGAQFWRHISAHAAQGI